MGFDLTSIDDGKRTFRFNQGGWDSVLRLACLGGWKAAGCVHPRRQKRISYYSNDGQIVMEGDAYAIAEALERMLPDIPRKDMVPEDHIQRMTPAAIKALASTKGDGTCPCLWCGGGKLREPGPLEWFSGPEGRRKIKDFIEFCRGGAFTIG
jgi:hypothetical protein